MASHQDCPGNPSGLVGESDDSPVYASSSNYGLQPFGAPVVVVRQSVDDRSRTMDHLTPEEWLARRPIPPSFGLPPVVYCRGTRPIHAASSRPERKQRTPDLMAIFFAPW